jgi:hypothetical protein
VGRRRPLAFPGDGARSRQDPRQCAAARHRFRRTPEPRAAGKGAGARHLVRGNGAAGFFLHVHPGVRHPRATGRSRRLRRESARPADLRSGAVGLRRYRHAGLRPALRCVRLLPASAACGPR